MASRRSQTKTGGGAETKGHVSGLYSLAVGMPPFPGPDGWKWTKLSDVARLETGHTPSRRHPEYWDGDIPWIGIRDATANHGQTLLDTNQHTNDLGIANSSARMLPKNTVCLSRTASVGYVVVMGRPMATSQDFVNWVCSEGIDHQFLKYILLSENRSFSSFASGTTHQTIYFPEVKGFHVCLPSIGIQRKVASILSAYDDLIENNTRRIAILEEVAQSIYREWFVNFRFPGHENVKFVDSPLGQIPEGWEVSTIASCCKLVMGQSPKSEFYNDTGEGRPFHQGVTNFGPRYPTHNTFCTVENRLACKGDILFSVRAPVGRINIANAEIIIGRGVSAIRRHDDAQVFLFHQLKDKFKEEDIMGGGTIFKSVTKNDLATLPLLTPPDDIIAAFESSIGASFVLYDNLTRKNEILRNTRDLLLPKLISGKLGVEDLDIDLGMTTEAPEEAIA